MKSNSLLIIMAASAFTFLSSCNNDSTDTEDLSGSGTVTLSVENGLANEGGITLSSTTSTSTAGQKYKFTTLKYIISNIVLIKSDGSEYAYYYNQPDKGAFIVDQSKGNIEHSMTLSNIPAGSYSKVRFGLGITKAAWDLTQAGQASFWSTSQTAGLTWSWTAGYIFSKIEGVYGADLASMTDVFQHHSGDKNSASTLAATAYREVTLTLPNSIVVTNGGKPGIHMLADFSKYLSGVVLDATNKAGHSSTGINATVMNNLSTAFSVEHVHQ